MLHDDIKRIKKVQHFLLLYSVQASYRFNIVYDATPYYVDANFKKLYMHHGLRISFFKFTKTIFSFELKALFLYTESFSKYFSFLVDKNNKYFSFILSSFFDYSLVNLSSLMFKNALILFERNVNLVLYVYKFLMKVIFFFDAFFFILINFLVV